MHKLHTIVADQAGHQALACWANVALVVETSRSQAEHESVPAMVDAHGALFYTTAKSIVFSVRGACIA